MDDEQRFDLIRSDAASRGDIGLKGTTKDLVLYAPLILPDAIVTAPSPSLRAHTRTPTECVAVEPSPARGRQVRADVAARRQGG